MPPDLSWAALAPDLDALSAASSRADIRAALRAPLTRLNARLLVTAGRTQRGDRPKLEVEFALDPPALTGRLAEEAGFAILEAAAGKAAAFRIDEATRQAGLLRRVLTATRTPDALLIPHFQGRVRSVSLLAGEALRLDERSTFVSTRILVEAAVASREALERPSRVVPDLLTRRQRDCLDAALHGFNSIQIAARLRLQPRTVDAYIAAAARRLGAGNRVAAVALALQLGLIGEGS